MQSGRLGATPPRNGDWGPAYVIQGDSSDIGLLTLRPGDEMTNHIHQHCDESFIVTEGAVTLWVDYTERFDLVGGGVYRCAPQEAHYFVNESDQTLKLVFIKSPASPGDTVVIPWRPGDSIPTVSDN